MSRGSHSRERFKFESRLTFGVHIVVCRLGAMAKLDSRRCGAHQQNCQSAPSLCVLRHVPMLPHPPPNMQGAFRGSCQCLGMVRFISGLLSTGRHLAHLDGAGTYISIVMLSLFGLTQPGMSSALSEYVEVHGHLWRLNGLALVFLAFGQMAEWLALQPRRRLRRGCICLLAIGSLVPSRGNNNGVG